MDGSRVKEPSAVTFSTGRVKVLEPPPKEASTFIALPLLDTDSVDMGTLTTHTSKKKEGGGNGPLSAKYDRLMMAGRH